LKHLNTKRRSCRPTKTTR